MKPSRFNFTRPAFFAADALIGLILVSALAAALWVSLERYSAADRALANTREALRTAESALIDLQSRRPLPTGADQRHIIVRPLPDPSPAVGRKWVRVSATVENREASLVGLIPEQTPALSEAAQTRESR